jgi:hypothetical protein
VNEYGGDCIADFHLSSDHFPKLRHGLVDAREDA